MSERGYFFNPETGEVAPVPEAPYGFVFLPSTGEIRPATREEEAEERA